MDTDRNLLFGVLALQADLVTADQFGTAEGVSGSRERSTLTRLHASGGLGRVWLARDDTLGRDVALKDLRPERAGNPATWARFLREARVTGQLEHPNIVPVYEVGR